MTIDDLKNVRRQELYVEALQERIVICPRFMIQEQCS